MSGESVLIFGGGGHARSVVDVLERLGLSVAAVVAPDPVAPAGVQTLTDDAAGMRLAARSGFRVVVAIGDNARRLLLTRRIISAGLPIPPTVAGTATVAGNATLGDGAVVLEHAHIGPRAEIGCAVVVNTGAVIEHDCVLGDGVHCAPGSVLGGQVTCGEGAFIGAGATIMPSAQVGERAIIGAGAVLVRAAPAMTTLVGVPARRQL